MLVTLHHDRDACRRLNSADDIRIAGPVTFVGFIGAGVLIGGVVADRIEKLVRAEVARAQR